MRDVKFFRWILLGSLCLAPWNGLQAQTITNFVPRYGAAGDEIKIYGTGFTGGPLEVQFWNGISAASYPNGPGIATVTVPSGFSTGPVSVRYSGGAWNYSPEPFINVGPGPFIESVDDNYGAVGDTIYLHGVHFVPGSVVKFGGVTASSLPNGTGTQITTYVPSVAPGNVTLTVTASGITFTNPVPFTVVGAGPYIATFDPTAGSDSAPVELNGLHFQGTTLVKFNGVTATFDTVVNDKKMTAYAPSGVTTGPIQVTTPAGSYTTPNRFYGPISLTGFSPTSGPAGTQVVITGKNFTDASSVKFVKVDDFSGVEASFVVNNNNQITATLPDDAPTGIIQVRTPWGSMITSSNFIATPKITGFTPPNGLANLTSVQINGSRLVDNSGVKPTVKFNDVAATTISSWGPHQVVAKAPASSSGYITLTTADGTTTSSNRFYYPPQISSFMPNTNPPGTMVTISGQSLIDASSVLFNGVPSTNFTVLGNTSIQAEVPVGVTTGPVTVTTPGGTVNSTVPYYAVPVITAFAPSSGGPGTTVNVFGSSFLGTTAVKFNGVNASSFSIVNGSQLSALVPDNGSTGPISVTAPAGVGASSEDFVVIQVSDLRINAFTGEPDPVTPGEELLLRITLANAGPATATAVSASVTLAPGVVLKSVGPGGVMVTTNGYSVLWDVGTMNTYAYPELDLVLIPQTPGELTNTVTVSSAMVDPIPSDNTGTLVTTVAEPPELNIVATPSNQVRVVWPASWTGYVLQSTLGLTNSASWANVGPQPVTEGDQKVFTEPSTGAAKFYRLKK